MSKGILIDASKCTACLACEAACSLVKEGEISRYKSRIHMQLFHDAYFYYPLVCAQCEIAYCALTCPTRALEKNYTTGWVDFSSERCIGCQMCVVSCPFGAITVRAGKAVKCDLCGGDPLCVKVCAYGVLEFITQEEVTIKRRKEAVGKLTQMLDKIVY